MRLLRCLREGMSTQGNRNLERLLCKDRRSGLCGLWQMYGGLSGGQHCIDKEGELV